MESDSSSSRTYWSGSIQVRRGLVEGDGRMRGREKWWDKAERAGELDTETTSLCPPRSLVGSGSHGFVLEKIKH